MALDVDGLYRSHGPMVLRRCRQLLRDEELAVEAMQDTFVQLLRASERLDARAPTSLLYRTATNVCLNRLRSRRRRPEDPDDELVLRIASAPDEAELGGARLMLAQIFAREQPSTKTIAVLHLLDGLTLEEVAAEVGLSVSGVRKRLRTLRQHVVELEGVL